MRKKEARLKCIPCAKEDDEAMRARNVYALTKRASTFIVIVTVISIILANMAFVYSSILGLVSLIIYFILVGYCLGKVFLGDEREAFMRLMLGIFISICLFILAALLVVIVYRLNFMSLGAVLVAPLILLTIAIKLRKQHAENVPKAQNVEKSSYFSPLYIVAVVLIAYCFYLLIEARSGWVNGNVWSVVSTSFFTVFFLATLVLITIIFFSRTKSALKISLIIVYSILSTTIFAIVLYPGNTGDPLGNMGCAQMIYSYGTWRPSGLSLPFWLYWILKEKGLAVFTASVAKLSLIDVYWVHTFGGSILWGIFVPFAAYNTTKTMGGGEKVSLLAALLSAFYASLIGWGARVSGNGVGLIFLFTSLYFTLKYLKSTKNKMFLLLALLTAIVSGICHPLPGIMSFVAIFLAFSLKKYQTIKVKSLRNARFILVFSFLICVLVLPAIFLVNGMIYLYLAPPLLQSTYAEQATVFSVGRLLDTDLWTWIFGAYISYELKGLLHSALITFLGVIGMAYALRKGQRYDRVLTILMVSFFGVLIIDYRILNYTMVNVLFGASRLWVLRDFVALPFAALTINSLLGLPGKSVLGNPGKVFRLRGLVIKLTAERVFAILLLGLSLSAFATSSVDVGYAWAKGLQPTQLEVEAVKYIDEITAEKYIVITVPSTASVGFGFVGMWNPNKWYVYQKGSAGFGSKPSVSEMYDHMRMMGAGVGYFIASSFRTPNYPQVVSEASRIFGLVKTLSNENGEISIFRYRVPPLPVGPEVMAYYWDSPSSYFIQNDLMRVTFNPEFESLDVVDYWGDLYERIDFEKVSINGGASLGNLTSIEYYDPSNDVWNEWSSTQEIPSAARFEFRLNFPNGSVVGVVESGKPFVQLSLAGIRASSTLSLEIGDFSRLYIPGLVGGKDSYNVSSREYGLYYTASRTSNVTLHPAYNYEIEKSSLDFAQIVNYCNLTIHKRIAYYDYFWYDVYVDNNAEMDQWAYVEVWMPDEVYLKTGPPLAYSVDQGDTWVSGLPYSRDPIRTVSGAEVNWVISGQSATDERPGRYVYSTEGMGGTPTLPENYTDSGGGQNRMIFGFYLPAEDEVLVRLGTSIYYCEPRRITYVFTDSDDESYGLHNMEKEFVGFYNLGGSVYVGGLALSKMPLSLSVTENAGRIEFLSVTIPENTVITLFSGKGVNTNTDNDGDGVPDYVEAMGSP